jgi:hypothetical protein
MARKPVVLILVQADLFAAVFEGANDLFRLFILFKIAFQPETVGLVLGILAFAAGKIAAGEAKIVDGIEQVGFAGAVAAGDPYNPVPEGKGRLTVIFELNE